MYKEPKEVEITFSDGTKEVLSGLIDWQLEYLHSYDSWRQHPVCNIRVSGYYYTGLSENDNNMIYFVGESPNDGGTMAVKVGYSDNPKQRLKELQIGNPRKLVLLASVNGTMQQEKSLHHWLRQFSAESNEWFMMVPEIRNMVLFAASENCKDASEIISGIVSGRFRAT